MTNNFLPFCPTDTGTNLLTQSDYIAATDRTIGNQPGVASSKLNNKAIRQSTFISSQLAQFVSDKLSADVLDNGISNQFLSQLKASLWQLPPVYTKFTSGSGTFNKRYFFFIDSGNATTGATYTNNTQTFTVKATVTAGLILETTGTGDPALSGTLTKASGSGDSTLSFYAFKSAICLRVKGIGAGGGGGSSGTSGSTGGTGGNTTFGTTLLVGNGGTGGQWGSPDGGGPGGTASLGTGPVGIALTGGTGIGTSGNGSTQQLSGGAGASSPYGGAGTGATAAIANTGSGGGGAKVTTTGSPGNGGGAGGFFDALIYSPLASYAYVVGAAGTAASAGTSGFDGTAGGSGLLELWESF